MKGWGRTAANGFTATPTQISGLNGISEIVIDGQGRYAGLKNDGTAVSWVNNFGSNSIGSLNNVSKIIGNGQFFFCALISDGTIKCWDDNTNGVLGNGNTTASWYNAVSTIGLSGVVDIVINGGHACAVINDGTVKCWGQHYTSTPTAVAGLSGVKNIAMGGWTTCVTMTDDTVKCWGGNDSGQFGDGTTVPFPGFNYVPSIVPGLSGVDRLVGGNAGICAIMNDKTAKCWGSSSFGQLGVGVYGSPLLPKNILAY